MKKPIIVTKLKVTQFRAIKSMAESVHEGLNLNAGFPNPQPSMPVLLAALTALNEALEKWGKNGNRGSHADYVNLQVAALHMYRILTQLAAWCMASLDPALSYGEQRVLLSTTGFPLKHDGSPQGRLEPVQDLHLFFARNTRQGYIKFRWKRPLNVTSKGNVKNYLIYRSAANDFSTASVIASVTKTTFTEAPGIGEWFYWVAAANHHGPGAVGSSLQVEVFKNAL